MRSGSSTRTARTVTPPASSRVITAGGRGDGGPKMLDDGVCAPSCGAAALADTVTNTSVSASKDSRSETAAGGRKRVKITIAWCLRSRSRHQE